MFLWLSLPAVLLTCCSDRRVDYITVADSSLKDIPEASWQELAKKRIYFGHQSVGINILDGVQDIMREDYLIVLNIKELERSGRLTEAVFAHSRIGSNSDPATKLDAFTSLMSNGIGDSADIAFFKFCYLDVTAATDIDKVYTNYKNSMDALRKKYPNVKFIHVTVPLTTVQEGWKPVIKKLIGKPIDGYDDNIKRNRYNDLLRKEYEGREPIFDLAKVESTRTDGGRNTFTLAGKTYYSLVRTYTKDGGHLNETGRKLAATELLRVLAGLRN
jgi:hypothetical protein